MANQQKIARVMKDLAQLSFTDSSKVLYRGEQEIARYNGKLKPASVLADLDGGKT